MKPSIEFRDLPKLGIQNITLEWVASHTQKKVCLSPAAIREFKKWRRQRQRCKSMTTWIFFIWSSVITQARSSKSFILCICMKTIRANKRIVHFAYFFTTWPTWNNRKKLNPTQSLVARAVLAFKLRICDPRRGETAPARQISYFSSLKSSSRSFGSPLKNPILTPLTNMRN